MYRCMISSQAVPRRLLLAAQSVQRVVAISQAGSSEKAFLEDNTLSLRQRVSSPMSAIQQAY